MEAIVSALTDEFPKLFIRRKVLLTGGICLLEFIFGIPLVMQGGIYALQIVDWYFALFSVMLICILENITIGWIDGASRIYGDIELMIGRKPCIWWSICWKFITPVILVTVLKFNMTQITPVSYGTYQYPQWAIAAGRIIGMMSVIPIPIHMVIDVLNVNGTVLQRLKQRSKPASNWGPENMDSTVYEKCVQKQEKFSPHFTTSLMTLSVYFGLMITNLPVVSVVYLLNAHELYLAPEQVGSVTLRYGIIERVVRWEKGDIKKCH